ncbi:HNH endonuclease signature motif containing protein [Rhizobium leguminosarum]|uniref:HNH endonuclease signature motif containing protein n=1 Tax=Rhizobium leguminosarum TaxID=384 RepID=UPI0015DA19D1|nr:HNH endonuclease signature motif containing protein [Rhizobium leguminosarum]NZD50515.1 HNH endonuclease [Rhizobium leguminosarum]
MTKDTDQKTGLGKVCTKCGEWKLLAGYYGDKYGKFGKKSICIECGREPLRAWKAANPDKVAASSKRSAIKNSEKIMDRGKDYYERNKETILTKASEYRAANTEKVKGSKRKYYENNRDAIIEASLKWAAENPDKVRQTVQRSNQRRRKSFKIRLEESVSTYMRRGLLGISVGNKRTFEVLGYSSEQLKHHLEKQFVEGMCWSNWGIRGWHIDHIIPLSAFNYEKPDDADFKIAWALKNLRPLWFDENIRKSDKLDAPFQPSFIF